MTDYCFSYNAKVSAVNWQRAPWYMRLLGVKRYPVLTERWQVFMYYFTIPTDVNAQQLIDLAQSWCMHGEISNISLVEAPSPHPYIETLDGTLDGWPKQ